MLNRIILLGLVLMLLGCSGCGKKSFSTSVENTQKEVLSSSTPSFTAHPVEFDPEITKVGDTVAGMKIKSIKIGHAPLYYVFADLEGEIEVTGFYYTAGDQVIFHPDLTSQQKLPHVKGSYLIKFLREEQIPRFTRFVFDDADFSRLLNAKSTVGKAKIVLSHYQIRYVPEADNNKAVLMNNEVYLELPDQKVPYGTFRYIYDTAVPVRVVEKEEYHYLELPDGTIISGQEVKKLDNLTINFQNLAAWYSEIGNPNLNSIIGNHAALIKSKKISLKSGDAYFMTVERDKWDDNTGHYNGVEYEYWVVVFRKDPMIKEEKDDYLHAFCMIGKTSELSIAEEQAFLELSKYWKVPPVDFYN